MYEAISKSAQFATQDEANKWGDAATAYLKSEGFNITQFNLNAQYKYDRKGYVVQNSKYFSVTVHGSKGEMINNYEDYDDID